MYFIAIRENKILAKVSEYTLLCILCILAEDLPDNDDDQGFKDLIKFWKKHGIPIAKDLLNDMDEETGIIITMTRKYHKWRITISYGLKKCSLQLQRSGIYY